MKDKDYVGADKVAHMVCCCCLAIINPYLAIGAALGKEYGDYKAQGNHWCWWDLLADAIGTIMGAGIWWYRPELF